MSNFYGGLTSTNPVDIITNPCNIYHNTPLNPFYSNSINENIGFNDSFSNTYNNSFSSFSDFGSFNNDF